MISTLRTLVAIRFKEFFREPEIIFWALVFPMLLSWLLGVAIGTGGKPVRTVAVIGVEGGMPLESDLAWIEDGSDGVGYCCFQGEMRNQAQVCAKNS